jgi:hypothetical protein
MNRPVLDPFLSAMDAEGSQGFVRRSFEMIGLQNKPGCVREVLSGSPLMGGDVLRLGNQAMMVASVGEDPFGIRARLEEDSVPVSQAHQRCREWLMDTSKFQISVIFLSREGRHGTRVRQGTFGSLIGEDHPGSLWDEALQEWALPECVHRVAGRGHRVASLPPARLKVERLNGTGPGCRVPLGARASREHECALCCAVGGNAP